MVPRNAQTSERLLQGPQFVTFATREVSGNRPLIVHRCPTTVISLAHKVALYPENIPWQYFMCWMTPFSPWKYSQINWQMPGLLGCVSYEPSWRTYCVAGPWIGTSSMYGMVVWGISACKMNFTSSWKIRTELVQPIGSVTSRSVPKGVWKVVLLSNFLQCLLSHSYHSSSFEIVWTIWLQNVFIYGDINEI